LKKQVIEQGGNKISIVQNDDVLITDAQSALDFMAIVRYEDDADFIAINKEAVCEDFFKLSTGIAGEVLQKFVTYGRKLAIIGDFSGYTSKPLHDFIYECNNGRDIFFVGTVGEAVDKLAG
jgi:hypothetical protein